MKRLALLAAVLALPLALAAQNVTSPTASVTQPANGPADVAGILYAANFAHWTIKPSELGLSWTSPSQCYGTSGGINFKLFSTSAPITIVDVGVPANTETVTPSIASYNGAGCSVGLPATHAHSNYYLQSGTLGLQEALNWIGSGYGIVVVTPDWVAMGGTSGMITAATAGANTTILDQRNATAIPYTGNGTPASNSTGSGKSVLATSPTLTTPVLGAATYTSLASATKCASASSPAVCAAAPAGFVNVAASGTTVVVNTTAVTATSTILVQEDPSLSTALSVTCNATAATAPPTISARTAGTSFTITTTAPTTNPRCFSYAILN